QQVAMRQVFAVWVAGVLPEASLRRLEPRAQLLVRRGEDLARTAQRRARLVERARRQSPAEAALQQQERRKAASDEAVQDAREDVFLGYVSILEEWRRAAGRLQREQFRVRRQLEAGSGLGEREDDALGRVVLVRRGGDRDERRLQVRSPRDPPVHDETVVGP